MVVAFWFWLPAGSAFILGYLYRRRVLYRRPVTIRATIPDANIGLAMLASLGLTFPLQRSNRHSALSSPLGMAG
ncbi:sodium-dependent bicarbonate transport family permease [Vreelandella sedimenti]|uniref:sodium-dependent bicarbonate transport family permease n=1 Tax=Vreelandella sedimenti TaxID=2729618 RepID=UPI00257CA6FE|nr:sodium-dependent bicarbonate transport family permease [Halomonas sp. UBA3173]